MIELEDEVQEFEPGTRQILSVQVDDSGVRVLRPSTRLVLAVNSMDVGRREGARGVIDTASSIHSCWKSLGPCVTVRSVLKEVLDTSSM